MINPDANGEALPTVVRLYQIRGEIVLDNLDFATIWESEDPKDLGDGFLAVEELTIYPGQNDKRLVPIESQATHIVATGWFREPLGNTWYASYEIPRRHPDVVCKKAPESKVYPNPCFYALLDRSAVTGGPTPPAGFEIDGTVQCAPLGVVLGDDDGGKKKKKEEEEKEDRPRGLAEGRREGSRRRHATRGARVAAARHSARPPAEARCECAEPARDAVCPARRRSTLMRPVRIRVTNRETGTVSEHEFATSPVRLGRNPLNDLPLPYSFVSGWHAVIRFDEASARYFDLGSTNGTTLEGRRIGAGESAEFDDPVGLCVGDLDLVLTRASLLDGQHITQAPIRSRPRASRVEGGCRRPAPTS